MRRGILIAALFCASQGCWADGPDKTGPTTTPGNSRVDAILAKLTKAAGYETPIQVIMVSDDSPNAAGGGDKIYVNEGLLTFVLNDDELAGVLGHELGHVISHHAEKAAAVDLAAPIAGAAGGVAAGAALTRGKGTLEKVAVIGGIGAGAAGAAYLFSKKFTRDEEAAADLLAVKFTHDAGYDPRGLVVFLVKIQTLEPQNGFLKRLRMDHPVTASRIQYLSEAIAKAYPEGTSTSVADSSESPTSSDSLDPLAQMAAHEAGGHPN